MAATLRDVTTTGPYRRLVPVLSVGGAAGAVTSVALAVTAGRPGVVAAVGLALSWYVAGWVATRARPDHPGAALLLAVGALHLGAFGVSSWAAVMSGRWRPWLGEAAAGALYAAGFAALALTLALYPDGRSWLLLHRAFLRTVGVATALVAVLPPLVSTRLMPVLALRRGAVPLPPGLPLIRWDLGVDPFSVVPMVLVAAGLVVLVVAGRRADVPDRRVYAWPAAAGGVMVLLLLATPAALSLIGPAWSAVFVLAAAAVPWALLAGLTRYRLLAVDLQATKVLARGALAVLVLSCCGGVAALLDRGLSPAAAAGVAIVAALTGERLRHVLEAVADRMVTGGRVRRAAAEAELRQAGLPSDPEELAGQVADIVARALDVSSVRLLRDGHEMATAGRPNGEPPQLRVPVEAGGRLLGHLECGPRHGGWAPEQQRWVREVAARVGLLWENDRLSRALADRVADLEASRRRLVTAEEEARRRLERDLHDGVQQQLVALLVRLELLRALVPADSRAAEVTATAHALARGSLGDLRELVRGIQPPLLTDHGLVAALQARAAQLPVPVTVDADPRIDGTRLPAEVESAAYFVALEALTNVLKHAGGTSARVVVTPGADGLVVAVNDDGQGFDTLADGTGLAGMRDRVEALGGSLSVTSSLGVGTTVTAYLPSDLVDRG